MSCLDFRDRFRFPFCGRRRLSSAGSTATAGHGVLGCMVGLIKRFSSRKAIACKTATCVMISDAIGTSGMAGDSQLVEVINEVITCSMSFACSRDLPCEMEKCDTRRGLCLERLGYFRSIYRTPLVSRITLVEPSTGPRGAPCANHPQQLAPPCTLPGCPVV